MRDRTFLVGLASLIVLGACTRGGPTTFDEDVKFQGVGDFAIVSGDITLVATLDLPVTAGPHPAIILVPGGGPPPPDGPDFVRQIYGSTAEILVTSGFAVLRFDKRGYGDSGGSYVHTFLGDEQRVMGQLGILAGDILALVDFLSQHEAVARGQIGLLGFSEGGMTGTIAAAQSERLSFLISIVGPVSFLAFQSADLIRTLTVPTLWLYGGADETVRPSENIPLLEQIVREGKDVTYHVYPDVNHDLINVKTRGWAVPVRDVISWLRSRVGISP